MCNYCMLWQQFLHRGLKELHNYFRLGFMCNIIIACNFCMQYAAIIAAFCRLSNMLENIREASVAANDSVSWNHVIMT